MRGSWFCVWLVLVWFVSCWFALLCLMCVWSCSVVAPPLHNQKQNSRLPVWLSDEFVLLNLERRLPAYSSGKAGVLVWNHLKRKFLKGWKFKLQRLDCRADDVFFRRSWSSQSESKTKIFASAMPNSGKRRPDMLWIVIFWDLFGSLYLSRCKEDIFDYYRDLNLFWNVSTHISIDVSCIEVTST